MSDRNSLIAILLAKVETTEGTDAAPVAANAVAINEPLAADGEPAFKTERPKLVIGPAIQATRPLTPKGMKGTWSSNINLKGPGSAYSAGNVPETDPFWQSAGYSATIVVTPGSEKVTYKPAATGLKSHTEYYYVDGKLKKMLGCKTDFQLEFSAGGPVVFQPKRTGLYQPPTDTALVASPVYDTTLDPVADNIALSVNAYAAGIIRKFTLTGGNHIAQRANANAAGGLSAPKVRSRMPKFTIVLEDELNAAIDFESLRLSATPVPLTWFLNAAQYNRLRFTAGVVVIEDVKVADDDGTQITTISGGCYDSTFGANDAVQFSFE
jgi:hypothetical protein